MKNFNFGLKIYLASILLLMICSLQIKAQDPELSAPERFAVYLGKNVPVPSNPLTLYFEWTTTDDSENIDGFKIYIAEGAVQDLSQFSLLQDIGIDEIGYTYYQDSRGIITYFNYILERNDEELTDSIYTFYITAYNRDYESDPSNLFVLYLNEYYPPMDYIYFTTYPNYYAYKNTEFYYDADAVYAEGNTEDIVYFLVDGPEGMEINSETGEVTWTPTESGYYWAWIRAELSDNSDIFGEQLFDLKVFTCENPVEISGTVNDEDGNPIEYGYVSVYTNEVDSVNYYGDYYYGEVIDGEFTILADAGTYYLRIDGKDFIGEWWQDAYNFEDATSVTVECGESYTYDITVTSLENLNYYTVTGNVSYEDGTPIEYATVEFYSTNYDYNWRGYYSTTTDSEGNYEIRLPEIFTYIAAAYVNVWDPVSGYNNSFPLYWEQKYDPTLADPITLTEDRDGINFVFGEMPDYNIMLSGKVVNEENTAIPGCFVVAFLVNADYENEENLFNGMATISDDNGDFNFSWLSPGDYVLLAFPQSMEYAPGFYVEGETAVWTWSEASRISLDYYEDIEGIQIILPLLEDVYGLCNLGGTIQGNGDAINGKGDNPQGTRAIAGASVYLESMDGKIVKYVKSGSDGKFTIKNVMKGEYFLKIDKVGFSNYQTLVKLEEDYETVQKDVILVPGEATSVIDEQNISNVLIAPNPANDFTNISFDGLNGSVEYKVSNLMGSVIDLSTIQAKEGRNSFKLDTKSLSEGVYLLTLNQNGVTKFFKFLVVR